MGMPREAFGSAVVTNVGVFGASEGWAPLSPIYRARGRSRPAVSRNLGGIMPANRSLAQAAIVLARPQVDGVILAPIEDGPWPALEALRGAMVGLRHLGLGASVAYVLAVSRDGRIVPGRSPEAALFALAYRFES